MIILDNVSMIHFKNDFEISGRYAVIDGIALLHISKLFLHALQDTATNVQDALCMAFGVEHIFKTIWAIFLSQNYITDI